MRRLALPLLLLVCLLGMHLSAVAQYQLVLENPNALKRFRIEAGDEISIRVRGMDQMYPGELQRVKVDQLFIFGDSLSPDSIDRIHIARPHGGINMLRGALIMSAIIYPVMMLANLKHDQWTWSRAAKTAGFSASAYLFQRVLKLAYWRRYRLDRGPWRLRIMPKVEGLF